MVPPDIDLANVLELVTDGFLVLDKNWQYLYVNRTAAKMLNRNSPADLIGKYFWNEYPESIGTSFAQAYERAMREQTPILIEDYYAPWNRWFENRIYPSPEQLTIFFTEITARKQAEETLRQKEAYFRALIEHGTDIITLVDVTGRITYESPSIESILGYTPQELVGQLAFDFIHVDDQAAMLASFQRDTRVAGKTKRVEMRFRHKDGSWRILEAAGNNLLNDPGVGAMVVTSRDITERKHAEARVRESEEILRLFIGHAPAAMAMFDREMRYLAVSQRWMQDYKLEGDIIGLSHYQVFPEIPERLKEIHRRCLAGAVEKSEGDHFVRLDGSSTWLKWEVHPWTDSAGGIGGIVIFSEDITEQRQAEEALRESEARYRNLLDSAPVGIAVHSRGKIAFTNPAGVRLMGAESEEQLVGRSILEIIHPDGLEAARSRIQRLLAGETGIYPAEDTYLRLDGTPISVEVVGTAMSYKGEPAVQVIVTDITERKKADEELRLHRDRLEELSRRLVQARETEQRALGRELHDQIGQMLTALKLTLDIIPQIPPEAAAKKLQDGRDLVNDLLNRVSRLSLELRPPMLDDLGLLPTLLWHINRYQEQTGMEVNFKHSGVEGKRFTPEIETAAYRLVQEALTNVARHARAQHVDLQVRAGGGLMDIQIEDDGCGFKPQIALAKVDSSGLRGMRERTGLLSGTFHLQSLPGKGTQIKIKIPLRDPMA